MTRNDRILKDLKINLQEKLARNISDFVSLSESVDIDSKEIAVEVMTLLIQLAAGYAALRFNISPKDFADAAGKYYERAQTRMMEEHK